MCPAIGFRVSSASNIPIIVWRPAALGCKFTAGSGADLVDRVEEADERSPSGDGADRIVSLNLNGNGREPDEPRVEIDLRDRWMSRSNPG